MKSLRLLTVAFFAIAISNARAADSQKADAKATPSAAPDKSGLPDPVALVEGKKITRAELEKEFANALNAVGKTADTLSPQETQEAYRAVLEDMIIDRLLRTRSAGVKISDEELNKSLQQLKSQFSSDADLNAALKKTGQTLDKVKENIRVSLQQQKWIESQVADKIIVTEADAKAFYDANPDKFKEPETIRASHILIMVPEDATPEVAADKEKLAKATKDRITKGEDFAKVASEVSEDPGSKAKGGDLDYFPKGSMVPEFEDAAFKLKVGEVSDPVKSKYGWHIIKVTDKKEAHTITFDEVKDRLIEFLKDGKKKAAVNELITSVREKSDAKVFLPPLPKTPAAADQTAPPADQTAPPADQTAPPMGIGPQ
jgi:peptidyl-prolyl cis-trans isomerase C